MQSKWMRRLGLAALLAGTAHASVGCAEEREPRNFVQPNALPKSLFVGADLRGTQDDPEFYMRGTIVHVPYGAGLDGLFPATYAQPLSRIKWEIQEDKLIARMTHERIQNSDHKGSRRTNDGTVAAVFRIESHFDVKRAYNPGTGEELNVVEENMSDRPWYEREYVRVDWSENLVTDAYQLDTLSQLGAFGSIRYSPLRYKVEEPTDPNRPVFDIPGSYFDVTQKVFASPELWDTPWGRLPACLWNSPVANCNPTEVTLRLSFKKVVDRDYEPVEWTGKKMDAFGAFLEERFSYDRNFGLVDQNWHRFAALHNVWQKSHIEGSQCGVDFWRDDNGEVLKFKAQGDTVATDAKTGMPVPDPKGVPKSGTAIGVDPKRDTQTVVEGKNNRILTPDDGWGTDDACEFRDGGGKLLHKGAYCDLATKKCALPRYERKIRTIPWYFGPEDKNDLFPSTARALNDWNIAVKYALILGMKAEAERVGQALDPAALAATPGDAPRVAALLENLSEDAVREDFDAAVRERRLPSVPDVFVMCHNPTIETDHPACFNKAADGTMQPVFARIGDIRYNFVNLIEGPHSGGPWGIMVDAVDPLTGEKVAASVNEWIPILDLVVQSNMDIMRWVNGEVTDEQVTSGKYLRDWVSASKLGTAPNIPKTLAKADIKARARSIDTTLLKMNGLTQADMSLPAPLRRQKANENLSRNLGPSVTPEINAARQKMIGSRFEAELITPEMLQYAGLPPNAKIADEQTLNMASPLRTMHPTFQKWMRHQQAMALANNHACIVEQPEPNGIVGLARMALRDYPLPDASKSGPCAYDPSLDQKSDYPACRAMRDKRVHQWLREQFHYAVISHEMGHSMTLRHNFTGSADPFNYHQEYWQLRTRKGEEPVCTDSATPHTDGKECVGPRWVDPVTEDEVNGMIWRFANTTVMDYPGDPTGDMIGLGAYDKAAMRFIYGNVADVEEDAVVGTDKGDAYVQALDGTYYMGVSVGDKHYSKLNDAYKLVDPKERPCTPTVPNPKTAADYKCPRYSNKEGKRLIHPSLRDMKDKPKYGEEVLKLRPDLVANFATYSGLPKWGEVENAKGAKEMVRHPYTFMSDEYADIGNIPVYRHDGGADPYEMMQFLITSYENRYIFDNFRRDRSAFSVRSAGFRAIDRYFDKIHGMSKSFFLAASNADNASAFDNADSLQAISLAVTDAFDMFARVMTRPEPGTYVIDKTGKTPTSRALSADELRDNPNGDFTVATGSGEGRYLHNDYDYSKGDLWYQYPLIAGSSLEKTYAMYFLLEAENNYVSNSKEDYIDGRYKNTNFTNVFPNQVRRLMAQLMQGDTTTLGPYIVPGTGTLSTNKVARVQYLPWYAWDESDTTTTTLDYPQNAVVLNPLYGWNQQMYGIVNAFVFGATKLTMDTTAQLRIFSTGDGATVSFPLAEQVRYTDPFSSITYVARNFGTERINTRNAPVMRTGGARMLQYANELAEATFETSAKDPVTGALTFVRDGNGNPVCKVASTCAAQTAKLKGFSSNIDTVRQVSFMYGYGPL